MSAPDEPSHAVKAAAVARGDFSTSFENVNAGFGFIVPNTEAMVPSAYVRLTDLARCYQNARGSTVPCAEASAVREDGPIVAGTTYVGAYQPLYYAIVGWPSRLLSVDHALYVMRAVAALVSAALLASGLASAVAAGRRHLLVVVAAVGITPMVVFLTASINPNGLEIAAAFCVWLATLDLVTSTHAASTRLLARVGASGVVLAWCRPLSPAFLVVIVAAVLLMAADRSGLRALWRDRRVRILVTVLVAAAASSAIYVMVNQSLTAVITHPPADPPSHLTLARMSFGLTGTHIEQMIGLLGWISFTTPRLPRWLVDAWEFAAIGTAAIAFVVGSGRQRFVLAAVVSAVVALPVVTETLAGAKEGISWQGRYALPLALGVPILTGWAIDTSSATPRVATRWGATLLAVALAAGWVVAQASVIAQAADGDGAPWTSAFRVETWAGPIGPRLLLGAGTAAALTVAAWLVFLCWGSTAETPTGSAPLRDTDGKQVTVV
jgi:hypothetical protein